MGIFSSITNTVTSGLGLGQAFDFVGDNLLGGRQADAARDASRTQAQAADRAIALQRESRDLAREDLAPFVELGEGQINALTALLTPEGQADYVENNPFYQLGLDNLNQNTLNNQAARGKLGSGGTLSALQDNAMLAGLPLLQNQQNQLFNAVNLGQASASGAANNALLSGNALSNLTTQRGNAVAAGTVGAANARQAAVNNLLNLGGQLGGAALGGGIA